MTESTSIQASSSSIAHANSWSFVCAPQGNASGTESTGRLHYEMAHAKLGVVSSLYVALRAKHGPAASHSLRVARWASLWGVSCELGEDHLQLFETVGLLHEIGKIGIPDRVLQKPDKLTENEKSMMDLHIQVGIEILRAAGASNDLISVSGGIRNRIPLIGLSRNGITTMFAMPATSRATLSSTITLTPITRSRRVAIESEVL